MVIELTDDQAAKLHVALVARFATALLMRTANKPMRKNLKKIAIHQNGKIENVLAEAAQRP